MIRLIAYIMMFSSCTVSDKNADSTKLLASDYRLFANTPAWNLAKAVRDGDTVIIAMYVKKNKALVDYKEPIYGGTLLTIATYHQNYNSIKTLLEMGANPNKQRDYDGLSPLMESVRIGLGEARHPKGEPKFLVQMLKYGGDPNAVQQGDTLKGNRSHFTPLILACETGSLEYVKILVEKGADINLHTKRGYSPLYASIISEQPAIVLYLLEKGANYNQPLYVTSTGEKKHILDALANWSFDKGSDDYEVEQKIRNFLNQKGVK